MKSREYIINELESFTKRFSKVRVRYEYDENALVHTVEVLPNEVYHLNEEYISWEWQMFDKFIALYPTENLCFISDDALVGIKNAELTLYGTDYTPISTSQESITFDPLTILIQQTVAKRAFNVTFAETQEANYTIEPTQVPSSYSSKNYLLAA